MKARPLPARKEKEVSLSALHVQLPAVAIRVVKPKSHVRRARSFRADLVTGIFQIDFVFLQMRQRLAQDRHIRQMKRHVLEYLRRRLAFEQRDGHVFVADRDPVFEFELFF